MTKTSSSKRKRSRTPTTSSKSKASASKRRKLKNKSNTGRRSNQSPPNLKIRRTSGRVEPFKKEKLAQTLGRSGTPFVMAKDIAETVTAKIIGDAEESPESLLQSNNDNSLTEGVSAKGNGKSENVAINNKQDTKEIAGDRLRELIARELEVRNRQDIALSYGGERPESIGQGSSELAKDDQPLHDNMANNLSHLVNDNSTRFARSTKIQSG